MYLFILSIIQKSEYSEVNGWLDHIYDIHAWCNRHLLVILRMILNNNVPKSITTKSKKWYKHPVGYTFQLIGFVLCCRTNTLRFVYTVNLYFILEINKDSFGKPYLRRHYRYSIQLVLSLLSVTFPLFHNNKDKSFV